MYIEKIIIENYRCFEGSFTLNLNPGLNILVGDNEAGKSTILEAVHLALSGWISGKYLKTELTESLFNNNTIERYLESHKGQEPLSPPQILIELFFNIDEDESLKAFFEGNANSLKTKACGVQFKISFNEKYEGEYEELLKSGEDINSLPIEYYDYSWSSFARDDRLTPRLIPIKSSLIDSSNTSYKTGSNDYVSRIIRTILTDEHKVRIAQAHRKMKDNFMSNEIVKKVNKELNKDKITDKTVELSVDVSTKTAWENSLVTNLDNVPFRFAGKGEQCLIKTKLALSHDKAKESNMLLLEEPENHLSHSKLNYLIRYIKKNHEKKQIIISTHSSFVANKLGLKDLILLNVEKSTQQRREFRITALEDNTQRYFEKLPGYDTLRLLLCKKAILVEGDSDELVVQKAYMSQNSDRLPIEDEIDVISVRSLAFKRFLDIARIIKQLVVVVTDNDGDYNKNILTKYKDYNDCETITICADDNEGFPTLEPQIVESNKNQLKVLRDVLKIKKKHYPTKVDIIKYMQNNKTECALKIFDTDEDIKFPKYILDAIK